jgi:hypothetical protein
MGAAKDLPGAIYVSAIQDGEVLVQTRTGEHAQKLKRLGGRRGCFWRRHWTFRFGSRPQLATIARGLAELGALFQGGPHGWPPSAVLSDLRDRRLFPEEWLEARWTGTAWETRVHHPRR